MLKSCLLALLVFFSPQAFAQTSQPVKAVLVVTAEGAKNLPHRSVGADVIDDRIPFQVKYRVQQVLWGKYSGTHISAVQLAHSKGVIFLPPSYVAVISGTGINEIISIRPAQKMVCFEGENFELPTDLRISYKFALGHDPEKRNCLIY